MRAQGCVRGGMEAFESGKLVENACWAGREVCDLCYPAPLPHLPPPSSTSTSPAHDT